MSKYAYCTAGAILVSHQQNILSSVILTFLTCLFAFLTYPKKYIDPPITLIISCDSLDER